VDLTRRRRAAEKHAEKTGEKVKVKGTESAEKGEYMGLRHADWRRTLEVRTGLLRDTLWACRGSLSETLRRPGLRGLAQKAPRRAYPAASDLVGIYEDVGAVLITFGTSIVPSFRFAASVSSGSAVSAIRTSTGCIPFERKIFPPVSST
jgi:hypothetical protein